VHPTHTQHTSAPFFGGFVCCRRGASTLLSSSGAATVMRKIRMKVLGLLFV